MAEEAKYIYIAAMDVEPDKEAAFNEVYDTEHIPTILKVPGVISATRYEVVSPKAKFFEQRLTKVVGRRRLDPSQGTAITQYIK